jgi:ribonuclease HII
MHFKEHDIVLVKGTALDVGSYNHQPWSATINNREQITEDFLWINPQEPQSRTIKNGDPILFIVPIAKIVNEDYYAETHQTEQPYLIFTDEDIDRLAPLNQFLEKPVANSVTETPVEKTVAKPEPEVKQEPINYIGSDEVGNGSYFGGIVTASVLVRNQADVDFLLELGVRDSKKLSDKKVRAMAPEIKDKLEYAISEAIPAQYNQAIASGLHIKEIMAILHNDAIGKVSAPNPDYVLIDEFASASKYKGYLEASNKTIAYSDRLRFEKKAESKYLAVAAASILARDAFLTQIETMSDFLHMPIKQGVTAKVKEQIAQLMRMEIDLTQYAKVDFKTTEEVRATL